MKVGMIGFGFMGGVHLSATQSIADASVTAISSRTQPTGDAQARGNLAHVASAAFPADITWYGDWRQLLRDPDIDAVDICLPTHLHKEVAIAALERGKHVLCEKPMALTCSDCDEMLAAAARNGRTLMVGHILRFMFPYQYAASFVTSIGRAKVKTCTLKRQTGYPQWSGWLSDEKCSGGAILDLLTHDIDHAIQVFGLPTAVSATGDGEIDTMTGKLRYTNGPEVTIEGGWYEPGLAFSAGFEIETDDAALTFAQGRLLLSRDGREESIEIPRQLEYLEQMSYFIECCRTNTSPELCLPAESAQAVRVANRLKESRSQGGKELSCGR